MEMIHAKAQSSQRKAGCRARITMNPVFSVVLSTFGVCLGQTQPRTSTRMSMRHAWRRAPQPQNTVDRPLMALD